MKMNKEVKISSLARNTVALASLGSVFHVEHSQGTDVWNEINRELRSSHHFEH
jgi:hypothetical protein